MEKTRTEKKGPRDKKAACLLLQDPLWGKQMGGKALKVVPGNQRAAPAQWDMRWS